MHFKKKNKKKEEKRNSAVLDGTVPPSSPGHATGEEKFLFFSVCFFLSLAPHVPC
jgi:hypothetical protein